MSAPGDPPLLAIEALSKRYRSGEYGVRDLTLAASAGVLGLLGPNGAGKTTLLSMLATVTPPTSGRIRFADVDVVARPEALRPRLGYLPQDFGVPDNLTAREMLAYLAALKGVGGRRRIEQALETVNLHAVADRPLGGFSGGMKQRLGIAQAILNQPDLLLVDEPTAGLDPEERARFRNLLWDLGRGKLVVLSTHIVSDIESIASEIAVLHRGRVIACGPPQSLLASAAGQVYELVVSDAEFTRLRATHPVSSAVRHADGVAVRVISARPPSADARPAEPSLEDAYLCCMSRAEAPATAPA